MTLHVFCGPSLSAERVRELAPGAALHPRWLTAICSDSAPHRATWC